MALASDVVRLQEAVTTVSERVNTLEKTVASIYGAHAQTAQSLATLKAEHEREVALLKQQIEAKVDLLKAEHAKELALVVREVEELKNWRVEQKKQSEEWGRRLWAFGPNLLAAIVGGLVVAALNYFFKR